PLPPPPPGARPYPMAGDPEATAPLELCPHCKTPREGHEPYCEGCRYPFASGTGGQQMPPPPVTPSWPAAPQPPQQAQPHPQPQPPGPAQGPVPYPQPSPSAAA